ncbi:uncharacterized protein LOC144864443 [Branchiostoma floridae x Branchiostoma japonicum]
MATSVESVLVHGDVYPYAREVEAVRCLGRTCEETHKCIPFLNDCDGIPDCLDCTEEKRCVSAVCKDTMLEFGIYKEISIAQYCDGEVDCRTGVDESPGRCAMFTNRFPCIRSNRFVSRNNLCDGIPDCEDASDEDACIVCDDCMARKTSCGYVRCGIPDQYRCGLIYSPGYPTAFPSSVICLWTIDGPRGSYVTLLLLDVDLPCTSRVLQVRDRFLTVGWNTIHGLCRGEGEQKRYVSSSNDMQLAMLATSHNADFGDSRGFMATFNVSTFIPSRQVQNLPDDAGFICPCGWRLFRRNCYLTSRHHVPVNWEESDAKCREFGANLTSIADQAEMEFLHLLLVTNVVVKRIADPMLFIGLYDTYHERQTGRHMDRNFVWTDGIPVTYTDWSPMDVRTWFPQPDGAKINFCVAIVMKNVWGTDQWYDVACDDRATRSFICKRAARRVTRPGDNG